MKTCDYCGTHNDERFSICSECGKPLPPPVRVVASHPGYYRGEMQIEQVRRVKVCPHCGTHNPPFARFCIECGRSVPPTAEAVAHLVYVEYGGFWRRVAAYLIDGVILNIIDFCILMLAGIVFVIGNETGFNAIYYGLGSFVGLVYFVALWSRWSRTVGMMALGLKIVDGAGRPIKLGRSLVRYFGYFVSALPLGLGFFWIGWDSNKQGWHDKLAGTYVVKL